jgi:hypothetical protein
MGGAGSLVAIAAALRLSSLASTGCNEPPATNYGNPNTLDRKNLPGEGGVEPLVCSADAAAGFDGGCPSFAQDIFPYFKADGKWRCADAQCHGGKSLPEISDESPEACLASLRAATVGGQSYLASGEGGAPSTDPNASTLLCNLQGACGRKMPEPPGADPTNGELCMIEAWLKCGAPR